MPQFNKSKKTRSKHDPIQRSSHAPNLSLSKPEYIEIDKAIAKHQNKIYNYVEDEMMRRAMHDGITFTVLKRTNVVHEKEKKLTRKEKLTNKRTKLDELRKEILDERQIRVHGTVPVNFDDVKEDTQSNVDENVFSF